MICISAARGLEYLHTGTGAKHRIIHRDVKNSNILLDENWVAKISDFGLSKIGPANQTCIDVITKLKGTQGYLDPEYFKTNILTSKSDVYAFGVVLFEVLCGRPAIDTSLDDEKQHNLAQWARRCIKRGTVHQIIDPHLRGQILPKCLKVFVKIAYKCLHKRSDRRPSMADIVATLESALASQKRTDSSTEEVDEEDTDIGSIHDNCKNFSTEDEDLGDVADPQTSRQPDAVPKEGNIIASFSDWGKGIEWVTNKGGPSSSNRPWGKGIERATNKGGPSSSNRPLSPSSSSRYEPQPADVRFRQFFLDEILKATSDLHDNFVIGRDASSIIYKGHNISDEHKMVAVKRIVAKSNQSRELFQNEIRIHDSIHDHTHLMSLIGYCDAGPKMFLVYEYMRNNTLEYHLYHTGPGNNDRLSWKRRLQICISAARGLNHLHTGIEETAILHGGLNSSSILLDDNWDSKIFSLGLSVELVSNRINSFEGNSIVGLMGYVDPHYILTGRLCTQSDVYSFGVVLLVLCAKRPKKKVTDEGYSFLPRLVRTSIQMTTLDRIIDRHLIDENEIAPACLLAYLTIALHCLLDDITGRPSMDEVVKHLESAQNIQVKPEIGGLNRVRRDDVSSLKIVCRTISESSPYVLQSRFDTEWQ